MSFIEKFHSSKHDLKSIQELKSVVLKGEGDKIIHLATLPSLIQDIIYCLLIRQ